MMKNTIIFVITICMVFLLLTGCNGSNSNSGNTNTQSVETSQQEMTNDDTGIVYKTPVDAVKIDLTSSNPSNDQIQFSYDENNRISLCQYQVDGHSIKLSYSYSGNNVQIYAFSDDYVAADESFTVSAYDADVGFTAHNGYYFSGCVFDEIMSDYGDASSKKGDISETIGVLKGAESLYKLKLILNVFDTSGEKFFNSQQVQCMSPLMIAFMIEEYSELRKYNLDELLSMDIEKLTETLNDAIWDGEQGFGFFIEKLGEVDPNEIQALESELDWIGWPDSKIEGAWIVRVPGKSNDYKNFCIYCSYGRYYWFWIEFQ